MKGFFGKLLRVNLTDKTYHAENIPDEIFKRYLGGKGLGSYLLLNQVPPGLDPLSPHNKLIFTTGPITGTILPGSSRYGVFSKSPLTGLYAESYSGGKVPVAMRNTGYDAIIVEGCCETPVYLVINDHEVIFKDASHVWGTDTYTAEDTLHHENPVAGAQAIVIGPAGEQQVRFACIENNYWRSAGRTGMGAVMGSKRLKGILFYGNAKCEIADADLLKQDVKELALKARDNPGVKTYQKFGTHIMVKTMNEAKAFPTRYWSAGTFDKWRDISAETHHRDFKVQSHACPSCFLACGKMTEVLTGPRAGLKIEGPEYETLYAFGGLCCIDKLEDIVYLNDLCDRMGIDTITAGNLVALVMEASARGLINYQLCYADTAGAARLIEEVVSGDSEFARDLAMGIKHFSAKWGLDELAVHVKGLEPPGYDPRVLKGMGLAYATSTRGACHLRSTFYKPELSGIIDPSVVEGKAALFIEYENRLTIFNTLIACVFFRDLMLWNDLINILKAYTGVEYSKEDLNCIANNVISLTREFNAREGAGKSADTLPPKLFSDAINDGEHQITPEQLRYMVDDYYRLRGWDEDGWRIDPIDNCNEFIKPGNE